MPPTSLTQLAEMPSDWQRALAVVAHPDDLEYGAAAAIARWTAEGREVVYLLATRGEAGIDSMAPEQAAEIRVQEQIASAAIVGVHTVEFLDHADGLVEYGLPLRRDIAAAIRRHRPELVITGNHRDSFGPGLINHADHRNVGWATIDAVRDAANRWLFGQLVADGLEPWSGVRYIAVSGSPEPTHAVDISDSLEAGIASLQAHSVYLAGLGDNPMADADAFLRMIAEATGARFGDRPATAFELVQG